MTRKSLEEIEAVHAARAANKLKPTGGEDAEPEVEEPEVEEPAVEEAPQPDELETLRQQYNALKGRLAPTQQQLEETRRMYDSERSLREAETARLQEELESLRTQMQEKEFDPVSILSDEEREMFDEETINLVSKVARAAAEAAAPKVDVRAEIEKTQQELAAQKIKDHRTRLISDPAKGLNSLQQLAHDPAFTDWLEQDGNEDVEPLIRSLFQAQTTREVDRLGKAVAKRIANFNGSALEASPPSRQTDARTSLDRAAQRRPRSLSNEEMGQKLNEAKQLARSRNPEDRKRAEEIINSL